MVKPADMTKVSVTGPKRHLRTVIDTLWELELLDIDSYDGELDTGEPFEDAEDVSQVLVDVRSLLSKLPEVETGGKGFSLEEVERKVKELNSRVESIEDEIEEKERTLSDLEEQRKFFRRLKGSGLQVEDLEGTDRLDVFVGKLDVEEFERNAPSDSYELYEAEAADVVFYLSGDEGFEQLLRQVKKQDFSPPEPGFSGTPEEVLESIKQRREEVKEELGEARQQLEKVSREWRGRLEKAEKFLTEKVEKSETPLRFGTTQRAFIAEGWIPTKQLHEMEHRLENVTGSEIHVEVEEGDNPPVKQENSPVVRPFESLTNLVGVPQYREIDPSFLILLTFPVMFGFMIGDAGYGLTTLAVFYAGYRMFPAAEDIFKSLMFASVATIIFGLAFGDAFGYVIFGSHSELAHATGIHFFEKVPILFHRAEHLGSVFKIAAVFGVLHVNLGYLLGAYNEYVNHGLKEAFLEKGSWLVLELGAAFWFFFGAVAGAPVLALSVVLLYLGEGIEGVVEIPSLLSNILSYLRIFGVSVAAVALAGVVNAMAEPLFAMHSIAGTAGGVAVLMVGHTFNTFIKIMEGFLQGIRLHYVELFTKFFEGGGRRYVPFGKLDASG